MITQRQAEGVLTDLPARWRWVEQASAALDGYLSRGGPRTAAFQDALRAVNAERMVLAEINDGAWQAARQAERDGRVRIDGDTVTGLGLAPLIVIVGALALAAVAAVAIYTWRPEALAAFWNQRDAGRAVVGRFLDTADRRYLDPLLPPQPHPAATVWGVGAGLGVMAAVAAGLFLWSRRKAV